MKKRILSLFLVFSLVFGVAVPTAMTPQADAVIGTILKVGVKLASAVIKGGFDAADEAEKEGANDNFGQAVLRVFKCAGKNLSGSSSGDTNVISQVDLSGVESELKSIDQTLAENNNAIRQLESTVTSGISSLSSQISDLSSQISGISEQITDSTTLLDYSNYLTEFFTFFNQYYEGLSYYDTRLSTALSGNHSAAYKKNVIDQFYHLENVEYTGTLHSAVSKMGRYLRGEYISAQSGGILDVLSQYYILTYKSLYKYDDDEAREKAAAATGDMIKYIYYAYTMGIYYEQAVSLHMYATMEENNTTEYKTDFNVCLSSDELKSTSQSLWSNAQLTVGSMVYGLYTNYCADATMDLVYKAVTNSGSNSGSEALWLTREVKWNEFVAEYGSEFYLPDPTVVLKRYFDEDLCDALSDCCSYSSTSVNRSGMLTISDNHLTITRPPDGAVLDDGTVIIDPDIQDTEVINIEVKYGSKTFWTIDVTVYDHKLTEDFEAGMGTKDYPYLICNRLQFENVWKYQSSSTHFVLGADLDYANSSLEAGLSIPVFYNFSGTFDGNGHTISNGHISGFNSRNGLFDDLTGEVRNLCLKNVTFYCQPYNDFSTSSTSYGFLTGKMSDQAVIEYCSLENCKIIMNPKKMGPSITGFPSDFVIGGVVGIMEDNSRMTGVTCVNLSIVTENTVLTPSNIWFGGLVGKTKDAAIIDHCGYTNDGSAKLSATAKNTVCFGGLVGWDDNSSQANIVSSWASLGDVATLTASTKTNNALIGNMQSAHCNTLLLCVNNSKADFYSEEDLPSDIVTKLDSISVSTLKQNGLKNANMFIDTTVSGAAISTPIVNLHTTYEYKENCNTALAEYNSNVQTVYERGEKFDPTGLIVCNEIGGSSRSSSDIYYYNTTKSSRSQYWHLLECESFSAIDTNQDYFNVKVARTDGTQAYLLCHTNYHSHMYIETVKEATCTSAGTKTQTCTCGDVKTETIEALGHDMEVVSDTPADCKSLGAKRTKCKRCGYLVINLSWENYGHQKVTIEGYPATCLEDGLTDGTICERCGQVFTEQEIIPATGHTIETITVLEPGCVSGGVNQKTCSVCGEIVALENIQALGHDYQSTVTEPTCEDPGYTTHTCTRCGDSYTDSYTSPTDHHYSDGVVTREPTCTEAGEMTYTCTCGDTHTEPIPTIDHDYAPTVTEPTCTEMGYTTHTCTQCDASYVDTYTVPNGHSWDEGETVTPPTLINTGLLRQHCKVCEETQETVIPTLTSCDGGMDCASRKFTDVAGIHDWSHIGIDYVIRSRIFCGTSDTTFEPDSPMTRAMLVAVLYRMDGNTSVEGLTHPFRDVPNGCWYEDALIWAYNNGIVSGTSTTTFEPDSNTTRQQIAAILYRYAKFKGYDVSASADLTAFPDHEAIADYAEEPMAWANATGLIQGSLDGEEAMLLPTHSATRAQLAAILMRFMKTVAK